MLRRRLFWIIALALALVASGAGYYYYNNVYTQAQEPVEEEAIATYTVGRGDLVITASGSGTLIPATETPLGFRSGGYLAEILVEVGDRVEAGQALARLDDADALDQVAQAEIGLRQAELELNELTQEVDAADLAAAQASLASAKANLSALTSPPDDQELLAARENLNSAQEALDDLRDGPDPDDVEIAKANLTLAEMNVRTAQAAYDKIAHREDVGSSQEAADLWEATTSYNQAKAEYDEAVEGATGDELADARAQVALAQAELDALLEAVDPDELVAAEAQLDQAQAELDALLLGASAEDLETVELSVAQAQLELASAERALAETRLVASSPGTVMAVEAEAGESVSTEAIITIADLDDPQVQFWVEESDMSSVAPGNRVNIVFEALPDHTFPGEIVTIDPMLVEVDGTPAVQSYASVDLAAYPISSPAGGSGPLLSGMNAEVEVVAGEALNAVLVPIQALRDLGPDQYAVFVVGSDGELKMRVVVVGLRDFVNAEILSGLEPGEVISLGLESGSGGSDEAPTDEQEPPPGIMRFFGG
jgi:multidrug efflux pump subunit AcrA (membrane-fusion protein)